MPYPLTIGPCRGSMGPGLRRGDEWKGGEGFFTSSEEAARRPSRRSHDRHAAFISIPSQGLRFLDGVASASRSLGLRLGSEDATADLVAFDRFEEGAEIAFAKALVTFALNNLEKDRTDHGLGEDLQ